VSSKISEPKYVHIGLLHSFYLRDDLNALFSLLDWQDYVQLQLLVNEKLLWEFFISFLIDEKLKYKNGICYILFWLGDVIDEINFARFSELL